MKNFQLIKVILIFILFSIGNKSYSQTIEETKYKIVSSIIDSMVSKLDFDYYHEHKEPHEPHKLDEEKIDTMILVDPISYELDTIANIESVRKYNLKAFPKYLKEYQKEKELWDNVKDLNKKVIFINSFSKKDLRNGDLKRLLGYKDLLNKLYKSDSVSWDVSKFNTNDTLQFEPMNSSKRLYYRYATLGFITISDVILNKEKTKAVFQIGVHYCINRKRGDGGITGFGGIVCLKKNEKGWFSEKSQRLWEE